MNENSKSLSNSNSSRARSSVWSHAWWLVPVLVYFVLRLPILIHAAGGQDEQWFAVPGWTVWNEGIPRIPFCPTQQRSTFFEGADRCLLAMPPALFYVQAPFHALFPPGYPTSRLPLFIAALFTVGLTYYVARLLGASRAAASAVALVMALGRPLLFTGTMVRPDLLCAMSGWLSLLCLFNVSRLPVQRAVLSGSLCGIAALFHPLALVFAMQCGAMLLMAKVCRIRKALMLVGFAAGCAVMVSMWLPLIVRFPDEFRSQFFSNVLDRAGPGLSTRLLMPLPSLMHHARLLFEFAGPMQCIALLIGTLSISVCLWRRGTRGYVLLTLSSIYLTAVVSGLHPIKGYWVYPVLWIAAGSAVAIDRLTLRTSIRTSGVVVFMILVAMLPGGGLRSTFMYAVHWNDPRYHAGHFIEQALDELPTDGLFVADLVFVYDVYLSGRETLLCQEREQYWPDKDFEQSNLLISWEGHDADWPKQYNAKQKASFGLDDDVVQTPRFDWMIGGATP